MNDFLHSFEESIADIFAIKGGASKHLRAAKENIDVEIKSSGKYLLYEFDKQDLRIDLYPFFKNVPKLKSRADYLILKIHKNKIYAIVIELKQKNGDPKSQVQATKHFIEYIIKCISRVKKSDCNFYVNNLELRGIEYSKLRRATTSASIKYDKFQNVTLSGNTLYLDLFLT